ADGTVIATVSRDMAQPGDGTPWTRHWVSLMAGYDPISDRIWLRTQAEGSSEVCSPEEPWNCTTQRVMEPATQTATTNWTPVVGAGSLVFGAGLTGGGARSSYWNGWIDDSQLWPLAHPDESVLRVIYGETVQERSFAGANLRVINAGSWQCMDVDASGTEPGANVQQWGCNGTSAQDWQFTEVGGGYYTLVNPNSGKCLDIDGTDGAGMGDGDNVWQWDCNGSEGQQWLPEKKPGGYWLKSKRSGKCLSIDAAAKFELGGNIVQWACADPLDQHQVWSLSKLKLHWLHGGTFRLTNGAADTCMQPSGASVQDGVTVVQATCGESQSQQWMFREQGNGYYTLTNLATLGDPRNARCLQVTGGFSVPGADISQGTCEPGAAWQNWKVAHISDDGRDGYRLINQHSGMVAEVAGGSEQDGANVVQNTPAEPVQPHQVWRVTCTGGSAWRCE
ncbi:RICIN domain-containing protein, partial [Actinomadura adrarensis]